jgi:hypothetical protein
MNKNFLFFLFLLIGFVAKAQMIGVPNLTTFDDRRIHFGFTLGLNSLDLDFSHYPTIYDNPEFKNFPIDPRYQAEIDSVGGALRADIANLIPGFTVGIVSNLRLTENLDLRFLPGLSFGNRKITYNVPIHDIDEGDVDEYSLRATYLDFPLLVKYKSKRIINQRPYMIGGLSMRYDMSKSATEKLLRLKKWSFYAEAGMGWDVYLQFFRLSTEVKYGFGLQNLLTPPPKFPQNSYYNLALKGLNSHVLTLCFHFE